MRPYVIALLAGILCLPATYTETRQGQFWVSLLLIILIATVSAVVSMHYMRKTGRSAPWWAFPLAFTLGALVAEIIALVGYNTFYGWDDAKLNVGFVLAAIEATAISVVGSITVIIAHLIIRRITTRSTADARKRGACSRG